MWLLCKVQLATFAEAVVKLLLVLGDAQSVLALCNNFHLNCKPLVLFKFP